MNHSSSLMVLATCTHQRRERLIAWDVEKNETRSVERRGHPVSYMIWTEDDNLHDKSVDIERALSVAIFEQKFTESAQYGPVFNLTTSGGILISSAKPTNLEYDSFFVDSCIWDCHGTMNNGAEPKVISR